jgi:acetylornithine deacetylase
MSSLLKDLIAIPAPSREEDQRADFLVDFVERLGHDPRRIGNNVLLGDPGIPGTTLMLNTHLDTVRPVEGWESDPFNPILEEEKITGLGSNDAGASLVSMIWAYHQIKSSLKKEINLLLLISAEEEISGAGGVTSVLPDLGPLDGVIVGEPTGMRPAVAERGLMVIDGAVDGTAGHAARGEGENAIYKAMEDIQAISSITFEIESEWLPSPGAQVTMITAGTNHNVVPDVCRFVVDVRSNDIYGNEHLLEMISNTCKGKLEARSTRLKPSMLDKDHFLMKTIYSLGLEPFGSSTLSDMALIPFPAIKMGPGDSARSHTAGEYILESELIEGARGYYEFLHAAIQILANQKQEPVQ